MKIDKSIPLPPETTRGSAPKPNAGRPRIYPFYDMEIGDSFFVLDEKVRAAAIGAKSRTGRVFTVRAEYGGFRCWRTE